MPSAPIFIQADPVRMSQVLINLLDNASKYTKEGGQIWLSAERRPDGDGVGDQVLIRVRDSGIGISPELLPNVFTIYTQGARTREETRGGLGIGLALVQSLVQMHGGAIKAESEGTGKGTEFTVRLPVSDIDEAVGITPPEQPAASHPARILVVDDSRDHLESLGILLRLMGHEVQLAASGPEALEAVANFRPDVALVDIGLPGMNGYEVAQRIREQPKYRDLVLVAQTGWGQNEDRARSIQAGFDHHLVKPVGREALEAILRSMPKKT
jgi:two-component system CheB/CheR fusion protein